MKKIGRFGKGLADKIKRILIDTSKKKIRLDRKTIVTIAILIIPQTLAIAYTNMMEISSDITPPASITNLKNITFKPTYINWTWRDPSTYDFSYVKLYIKNIFKANIPKGKQYYNSTDLLPNTSYRIGTQTVDTSGNVNNTWVNRTARTAIKLDKFGIRQLYLTFPGEREWFSKWDNGHARNWTSQTNDPDDTEFWTKGKGTGAWKTDGKGILKISGPVPRMHILKTYFNGTRYGYWHNVEITMYGNRVSDSNIAYGGILASVRTNHMIDADYCDTRGYQGRFRYDGEIDFEKEIKHGTSYARVSAKDYWTIGMPYDVWIGYKFVVYDLSNGSVKLELYMDETDGLNGGDWKKVNEFIDTGNNFGTGKTPCKPGINPALKLTSSDIRLGSESNKPNLDIYFRSDGLNTDGLWYKKVSIREIK